MNIIKETLYDFNDILIEPASMSSIRSRKEINIKDINGNYPLMTAPMDTVISKENYHFYKNNGIIPVLPRGEMYFHPSKSDTHFTSYGLDEFNELFLKDNGFEIPSGTKINVLIDIANGHMEALYNSTKDAKEKYGDKLVLMIGNVANPKTFAEYCMINVDYVRIGIGNGGGCWDENTLILTNNGHKKIKDISIGDMVLTHKGSFESVINIISYEEDSNLLEINGEICTDNHELYVIHKKDLDLVTENNYTEYAFFIEAKKINENEHLILSWEDVNV